MAIQFQHYQATVKILSFHPSSESKEFEDLIHFVAQVNILGPLQVPFAASAGLHDVLSDQVHRNPALRCCNLRLSYRWQDVFQLRQQLSQANW